MKARTRKKMVVRKQMRRVWKRMRRVRRVRKSNPPKGGRERKQPIERKNGGERKRKRGGKLGTHMLPMDYVMVLFKEPQIPYLP
jgi:hypothetical protein